MEYWTGLQHTEAQRKVMEEQEHHFLIKGIEGSGKTYTNLSRIAYLHKEKQVGGESMLNLYMDKQSAKQASLMYRELDDCEDVSFQSIYAFAYRIVKQYALQKGKNIRKPIRDLRTMLTTIAKQKFNKQLRVPQINEVAKQIAYAKVMLLQAQEIEAIEVEGIALNVWMKAYDYEKRRKQVMDFEDLLVDALHILMEHSNIREEYQSRYRFLHIDQAEDMSFAAHLLIKALLHEKMQVVMFANLTTHKSAWGAYPKSFDSFTTIYTNGEVIEWNSSYTLTPSQVHTLQLFEPIRNGVGLHQGEEAIVCKGFGDLGRLYAYAQKQCAMDEHIAFTYADSAYALPLIDCLEKNDISYACQTSFQSFFQDIVVTEMLGVINLLLHPQETIHFIQAYNALQLDISERIMKEVCELMEAEQMDVFEALIRSSLKISRKKELMQQMEMIRALPHKKTSLIVRALLQRLHYQDRLKVLGVSTYDSNLLVFKYLSQVYDDPQVFVTRIEELSAMTFSHSGKVRILPITSVSSYLFSHLCILDCIEHHFPKYDTDSLSYKDEKALFLSCLTHSRKLELFGFKSVLDVPCAISSFVYTVHKRDSNTSKRPVVQTIRTIQKISECHLKPKTRILHETLGEGIIKQIDGDMMQVNFTSKEVRNLNIKFCLNNELIKLA